MRENVNPILHNIELAIFTMNIWFRTYPSAYTTLAAL